MSCSATPDAQIWEAAMKACAFSKASYLLAAAFGLALAFDLALATAFAAALSVRPLLRF